jgi:hypothetical protein
MLPLLHKVGLLVGSKEKFSKTISAPMITIMTTVIARRQKSKMKAMCPARGKARTDQSGAVQCQTFLRISLFLIRDDEAQVSNFNSD